MRRAESCGRSGRRKVQDLADANPARVHARICRLQRAEFHAEFARDADRRFARDDRVRARRGGSWLRICGTARVRTGWRGGNSLRRLNRR